MLFYRAFISSRVVGYQQNDTVSGYQATGVTFAPVSDNGKMKDITISGYTGEYLDNEVSCGKLDGFGRSIARMYWVDAEEFDDGEEYWPAQYGWYSADGTMDYNDESLTPGEGLWFYLPNNSFKIQSAGQVIAETYPVALGAGYKLVSNPTPIELKLGNIWMTGYTGEYLDNEVSCGKLDGFGRSIARMYWVDAEEFDDGEEYWPAQYGWYSADGTKDYNDETVAPGQALWIYTPNASFTINFPSALSK